MTLPPLPEPWRKSLDRTKINTTALNPFAGMSQSATPDFYTSAQMQAYAAAAVAAEREANAKLCDAVSLDVSNAADNERDWTPACLECAAAIRARCNQ